jgi:hypothetical protein
MIKYIDADKLLEWVDSHLSEEDDGFPKASYLYVQGAERALNEMKDKIQELTIEFDDQGWCWDMDKADKEEKNLLLIGCRDPFIMITCILETQVKGYNAIAWRPLPNIPEVKK